MKAKDASVRMGGDIARFGLAIFLASAFGAVQVFVIPRRLDIVTFGEYRLFLLYVGYIGVLHFGLADGAFLRWAGQPLAAIRHDAATVGQWLTAISAVLLVLGLGAAMFVADPIVEIFLIALCTAALAMNTATLAGYALQAGGDFQGAGRVAVLPPGLFVAAMLLLPIHSLRAVLAAYIGSFAVATVVGGTRLWLRTSSDATHLPPPNFRLMVQTGLPVLGANLAAALSQFGDRILVSVSVPIATFALYGFASSVMVTASAATQTLSRVALSHAAREPARGDRRAILLGGFYDLIAAGFGVAMAGVPLFEMMVTRWLPAYASAIPIVRALVVGSPFWVGIHVVLVGTLQSYGMVKRQLLLELLGLAFVVVVCGVCVLTHSPLWVIAAGSSAAGLAAWAAGVLIVRRMIPGAAGQPAGRFVPVVVAQIAAVLVVLIFVQGWVVQTIGYIALGYVPTFIAARAAKRHGW